MPTPKARGHEGFSRFSCKSKKIARKGGKNIYAGCRCTDERDIAMAGHFAPFHARRRHDENAAAAAAPFLRRSDAGFLRLLRLQI